MKFVFLAVAFVGIGIWANMKAPKETAAMIKMVVDGTHKLLAKGAEATK